MKKLLEVRLIKSRFGRLPAHRATVQALKLRRIGSKAMWPDLPHVRGMIRTVHYLVSVKEIGG